MPVLLRASMIPIFLGCAIWTGYVFIIKTMIKRTSIEQIALRIEQCHPELQERIISSLQLWQELPENKYGYSTDFIDKVVEEAHASIGKINSSEVLANESKKFKRSIGMMSAIIPLIITIVLFPSTFRDSLYNFVHPLEGRGQTIPVMIEHVAPGDITLQPGENVDIRANVTGTAPHNARLYHRAKEREWHTIALSGKVSNTNNDKKTRI